MSVSKECEYFEVKFLGVCCQDSFFFSFFFVMDTVLRMNVNQSRKILSRVSL